MDQNHFEHTQQLYGDFARALSIKDEEYIRQTLADVNGADVAMLLSRHDAHASKYVIGLFASERQANIIENIQDEDRAKLLKIYDVAELIPIINLLDSDDAADVLSSLSMPRRREVLMSLDDKMRMLVADLLTYEENVAGGLMAKELVKGRMDWTVAQCLVAIRQRKQELDKFYAVYVVDDFNKLLGITPLYKLVLADDDMPLRDICDTQMTTVDVHLDKGAVAELMRKYDLETVPVVDVVGRLVGRITIDDVVDVIAEQAEAERQLMSGISEDVEEYHSVWKLSRSRLPWLLIGLFGGLVSVYFIEAFEKEILKVTAVAFFIPLIQATSGNVGIQSSSIVVQGLATSSVVKNSLWVRLPKVLGVAILNGLALSIVALGVCMLIGIADNTFLILVAIALFVVVLVASLIGTITPLLLNSFGWNPALASGPFITTINDILGLAIYLYTIHLII